MYMLFEPRCKKHNFFLNSKVAMIFNLHLKVKLTRLDCKLLSFSLRETKEILELKSYTDLPIDFSHVSFLLLVEQSRRLGPWIGPENKKAFES